MLRTDNLIWLLVIGLAAPVIGCEKEYSRANATVADADVADVGRGDGTSEPDDAAVLEDSPVQDAPDDATTLEDTPPDLREEDGESGPLCTPVTVGDSIVVIDWPCPVSQICDGGAVMVDCDQGAVPGSDWYCFCWGEFDWDYGCVEWARSGEGICPDRPATLGSKCAYDLGGEACGQGLYCRAGDQQSFGIVGTCVVAPALCSERACYTDSDCPADMDAETGCYGAAPLDGVLGLCRIDPGEPPTCVGVEDCPPQWECVESDVACGDDPCTCDAPLVPDVPGVCRKTNGGSGPDLWLPGDRFNTGEAIRPYWTKGAIGETSNWITCPGFFVELQTDTGGWEVVAEESCAGNRPGLAVELPPDTILQLGAVELELPSGRDRATFRVKGSYYNDCVDGGDVSRCDSGPYERFSSRVYTVER